ncbi:hypothetical protein DdX_17628 [Ditylenchus destructor]|uniref:Uncharacterized protein n=1 Tax=Ditylenchus destructor TaxID=166010 RepID=A0AAD4QYZ9_9BILA|nr:hypothetical protein DdX_17628 [Ditylenchus destructor]
MFPAFVAIIFLLPLFSASEATSCYETHIVSGRTVIKGNYTYCSLIPSAYHEGQLMSGSQFGLGPENDLVHAYKSIFDTGDDGYQILSICIYERYDFQRSGPIKPVPVEFSFRCVCNFDLCNTFQTFSAYLGSLRAQSLENYAKELAEEALFP